MPKEVSQQNSADMDWIPSTLATELLVQVSCITEIKSPIHQEAMSRYDRLVVDLDLKKNSVKTTIKTHKKYKKKYFTRKLYYKQFFNPKYGPVMVKYDRVFTESQLFSNAIFLIADTHC